MKVTPGAKRNAVRSTMDSDLHSYAKMFKQVPEGRLEKPPQKWKTLKKQWLLWYLLGLVTCPLWLILLLRVITGEWIKV